MALRSGELLAPSVVWTDTLTSSIAALRAVVGDWVNGQHEYFARSRDREEKLLRKLQRRSTFFVVLSLIGGAAVIVSTFDLVATIPPFLHPVLVELIGLSTAAAALIPWIHGTASLCRCMSSGMSTWIYCSRRGIAGARRPPDRRRLDVCPRLAQGTRSGSARGEHRLGHAPPRTPDGTAGVIKRRYVWPEERDGRLPICLHTTVAAHTSAATITTIPIA